MYRYQVQFKIFDLQCWEGKVHNPVETSPLFLVFSWFVEAEQQQQPQLSVSHVLRGQTVGTLAAILLLTCSLQHITCGSQHCIW